MNTGQKTAQPTHNPIMPTQKRPTLADVARLAGVSRAMVSLVLGIGSGDAAGTAAISVEVRDRVQEAAKTLNFAPDATARALAGDDNRLIGVFTYEDVFPLEQSNFYYEFILGIEQAAARLDYNVILFTRYGGESQSRKVYAAGVNSLQLAGGTVFLGSNPDRAELARLSEANYPFIYIGRREVPGFQLNWIAADYLPAAREAAEHLLKLNHRHLAYVGRDLHNESNLDKIDSIRQAVAQVKGASLEIGLETVLGDSLQMQQLLRQSQITAILCSDAASYDATLIQLHENGYSVPEDISIISLADVNLHQFSPISPTYVSIDRQRWGERAVECLIDLMDGVSDQPIQEYFPCKLLIGASTAVRLS